jgi:hypothetical protein
MVLLSAAHVSSLLRGAAHQSRPHLWTAWAIQGSTKNASARGSTRHSGARRSPGWPFPRWRTSLDQEYAAHRQRFLAEQGYAYTIVDADDVLSGG